MPKKVLVAALSLVTLFVVGIAGISMFMDVNQFRPRLEHELEGAVGRRVNLGNITLSLLAGNVSVDNVSIADDPAFGTAPFVAARAVKVGIELWPLIASRNLKVRSFTLEQPQIVLRRSSTGNWNFSTLGVPAAKTEPAGAPGAIAGVPRMSIANLAVADGQITIVEAGRHGRERVYEAVNIEATNLSYASQFPFRLDAKAPGGGTFHLDGRAGPLDSADASATPVDANVQIKHFDIAATGFVDPTSGLAGVVDFNGGFVSDGREARSKGTVSANKLQLVQGSAPARVPVQIDYQSAYDLKHRSGAIEQGDVHVGRAWAHLTGSYKTEADSTSVRLRLVGRQMPVPELEAGLPAIGVTLPAGASLKGGTLDLDLAVSGSLDHLVTTGPVTVANTTLTAFDLGSKMGAVAAFGGLPRNVDTRIQELSSTLRVDAAGMRADALQLVVPAVGQITGNGTIGPQGALDFKMLAKLTAAAGIGATVSRATSFGRPENGTPFLIKGTTSSPVFAPDLSAAVRGVVNKENATEAASGLLKEILRKKRN